MKRKTSILMIVAAVLIFIIAGCGRNANNQTGNDGNNPPDGNTAKVEIRLSTWAGVDEAKELQQIIDNLNANSTTYRIVQDSNPAEYDTRIITQLSGATGPDLFWVSARRAAQFSSQGVMLDITDRLRSSDHPAAKIDDYYDSSLQPFTNDGKIFGLPWLQQPVMLYVNKALFDEAQVSYPDESWTWDHFADAATKLTLDNKGNNPGDAGFDRNAITQWGFTVNGWPPSQMFIWQNGGDVISEDFSESPIDSPEAVRALKFYSELITGPLTPSQQVIRDRGFGEMFKNGQIAMFMGGAADDFDMTMEDVQAFMVPAGPNGTHATFADVLGMGINQKSKNPDAAFAALADLTDAIHHWKIMPPRTSLADLNTLTELHPKKSHSLEAIIASMEFARPYRYYDKYPEWDNIYWTQLMDPIVNSNADPDTLIPNVKPLLDNALK